MKRSEYQNAAWFVKVYVCIAVSATGMLFLSASLIVLDFLGPWLGGLGNEVRNQVHDEALTGTIGGLLFSLVLIPVLLLVLVPALLATAILVDYRFGLRCPNCKRSITFNCIPSVVLETGKCRLCQHPLFEPPGS